MITNHPEGDMNVMNPSHSCQDSLIKATKLQIHGGTGVKGLQKSGGFIL